MLVEHMYGKDVNTLWEVLCALEARPNSEEEVQRIRQGVATRVESRHNMGEMEECLPQEEVSLRRLKLHGIKQEKVPKIHGLKKTSKEPFFGLQKIKPFLEHQKDSYVRNFGLFLVVMGPKNAFFGAMDCSLREASRKEQSIVPPKSGNDCRIEESSRRLHWSDITGTLELITLYNMLTRADIQCSKQALQI